MTSRNRRTSRLIAFVLVCSLSIAATWLAHGFGRDTLGPVGGVLVALVAAMMLGAVVYALWLVLLSPRPSGR
jgi:hypothetical protein